MITSLSARSSVALGRSVTFGWKHLMPGTRGLHTGQQPLLSPAPAASHGLVAAARHQVQGELWRQ